MFKRVLGYFFLFEGIFLLIQEGITGGIIGVNHLSFSLLGFLFFFISFILFLIEGSSVLESSVKDSYEDRVNDMPSMDSKYVSLGQKNNSLRYIPSNNNQSKNLPQEKGSQLRSRLKRRMLSSLLIAGIGAGVGGIAYKNTPLPYILNGAQEVSRVTNHPVNSIEYVLRGIVPKGAALLKGKDYSTTFNQNYTPLAKKRLDLDNYASELRRKIPTTTKNFKKYRSLQKEIKKVEDSLRMIDGLKSEDIYQGIKDPEYSRALKQGVPRQFPWGNLGYIGAGALGAGAGIYAQAKVRKVKRKIDKATQFVKKIGGRKTE